MSMVPFAAICSFRWDNVEGSKTWYPWDDGRILQYPEFGIREGGRSMGDELSRVA